MIYELTAEAPWIPDGLDFYDLEDLERPTISATIQIDELPSLTPRLWQTMTILLAAAIKAREGDPANITWSACPAPHHRSIDVITIRHGML